MTDPVTPGAPAAPAAAPSGSGGSEPTGTFGATRGSGLARGKRAHITAAPTAPAEKGEYQPTVVAVITPQSEYKNPFDTSAPVEATPQPAAKHPVPEPAASPEVPPSATEGVVVAGQGNANLGALEEKAVEEGPALKAELNILPPEEKRPAPMHWDHRPEAAAQAPAPAYEPRERRDRRGNDRRGNNDRPANERRGNDRPADGRPAFRPEFRREREAPKAPEVQAPAASKGFIGWLKGLFGAKPPVPSIEPERRQDDTFDREGGHHHRRRHRGGRGRNHGGPGGPGQFQGSGGPRSEHENGGERQGGGGHHRHRHRGGRGRNRDGGGPRPEGQQGGGYI